MEEEKKRDKKRCKTSLYCYNQQQTHNPFSLSLSPHSLSYTLLYPVLGYGPWPASVFYLYPVAQHSGGVHDFVSGKTGCVYREMRMSLPRELNHRNSYILSPLQTTMQICVHTQTHTLSGKSSECPTSHLLPKFQRAHTLCFCINRDGS